MILVDSSVWVDYLRGRNTREVATLSELPRHEDVYLGDLILCEVLQGAHSEQDAQRIEALLRVFLPVAVLDGDIAVRAAANYRALRGKGITIRKTIDLIIGTFCIVRGFTLLHNDRDFEPMARHLGLKVR